MEAASCLACRVIPFAPEGSFASLSLEKRHFACLY